MITRLTTLVLAAVLAVGIAAPAGAEILESSFTIHPTVDDWRRDITVDQFHPDYGQLNSVAISLSGTVAGAFYNENLAPEPSTWSDSLHFALTVDWNDARVIDFGTEYAAQGTLNEYDGAVDFEGPSGNVHTFLLPITGSAIRQDDLAEFVGTDLIHLIVETAADPVLSQSRTGTQLAASRSTVTITFIYNYTPAAVPNQAATWSQVKALYR